MKEMIEVLLQMNPKVRIVAKRNFSGNGDGNFGMYEKVWL